MISSFYFQTARYLVSDEFGNEVVLENNYHQKTFKLKTVKKVDANILVLKQKLEKVAVDLLERKHNVNFAYKFQI